MNHRVECLVDLLVYTLTDTADKFQQLTSTGNSAHRSAITVADLERAEPAPPLPLWATDRRRQGTPDK